MRKTLLLVFIHGFKGDDNTFASFPQHLQALVSHALPNINVVVEVYPRFETRGELKECVQRIREWIENKVIDIEVARGTPSPTIDPSVHTILIGHSMGGIVAADTLLLLANDQPIPVASSFANREQSTIPSNTSLGPTNGNPKSDPLTEENLASTGFMFPHIQGILAFDTPFLGLAPGMVAHGLEGGHKMASNAYTTYNEVASVLGWGTKSEGNATTMTTAASTPRAALPAPTVDAAATPRWQSWGKYAMFAGAAGAVAAGGAAALYTQREKLSAGWSWAGSHLLFVGDLMRAEHLRKRVEALEQACADRNIGCANIYTNLGRGAREGYGITASVAGKERTFCNLPKKVNLVDEVVINKNDNVGSSSRVGKGMRWTKAINEKAQDETTAHMWMFAPRSNPGFYALGEQAKEFIVKWIDQGWYSTSDQAVATVIDDPPTPHISDLGEDGWETPEHDKDTALGKDWEGLDKTKIIEDDVRMRDEDTDKMHVDGAMEGSVIVDKAVTS